MKRILAVAMSMIVLASLASSATAGRKPVQHVDGTIALPTPTPDNVCFSGLQRRVRLTSQLMFPNGVVGFDFDVDPKTAGKKFELKVTGGAGADLDINFYSDLGAADDPVTNPASVSFQERKEGGEVGIVPAGYSKVIICAYAGNDVSFVYTADGK